MNVEKNSLVTLRCHVCDETGNVLDEGKEAFSYRHGCGMLLAGVEQVVINRATGYATTVDLSPEEAYGAYRKELVFEAARENLPPNLELEVGMTLRSTGGPFPLRIVSLTERGAMLDGNHPLAGRTLTFKVDVLDVQPPAAGNCASASTCTSQCSGQCAA